MSVIMRMPATARRYDRIGHLLKARIAISIENSTLTKSTETRKHMTDKKIYIVMSQTGTVLSRVLKRITGSEYNHTSISLCPDLHYMYSFGRRNAYNPFWGGFVMESPDFGTFKRFSETQVIVLAIPVDDDTYSEIKKEFDSMYEEKYLYNYDMLGLCLAYFNIIYKRKHHRYCSDYVREILVRYEIENSELFSPIVKPMDFLKIPDGEIIYCGKLREFSQQGKSAPA